MFIDVARIPPSSGGSGRIREDPDPPDEAEDCGSTPRHLSWENPKAVGTIAPALVTQRSSLFKRVVSDEILTASLTAILCTFVVSSIKLQQQTTTTTSTSSGQNQPKREYLDAFLHIK